MIKKYLGTKQDKWKKFLPKTGAR